jgi:hypothetical protein
MLDRAELIERLLLIRWQDLRKHARNGIERQHPRRQLDLTPGQRSSIGIHRR